MLREAIKEDAKAKKIHLHLNLPPSVIKEDIKQDAKAKKRLGEVKESSSNNERP